MANCSLMLFHGSRISRSLPCLGFVIFWTAFKLVEKSLQPKQLIRIQMPNPLNNFIPGHCFPFPPEHSRQYSRVPLFYHISI